jgi:hypothetical protein
MAFFHSFFNFLAFLAFLKKYHAGWIEEGHPAENHTNHILKLEVSNMVYTMYYFT